MSDGSARAEAATDELLVSLGELDRQITQLEAQREQVRRALEALRPAKAQRGKAAKK